MGKVGNLIGKKRGWLWLILAVGMLGAPCLSSCGHEDSDDLEKVAHRPGNDSAGGNGGGQTGGDVNGENGGGEVVDVSPIVGRWMVVGTEEIHVFEADGQYTSPLLLVGSYTYDDLHRWLYLSIDDGVEVYVKEYKCILDGEKMTWYDLAGRKTELRKEG